MVLKEMQCFSVHAVTLDSFEVAPYRCAAWLKIDSLPKIPLLVYFTGLDKNGGIIISCHSVKVFVRRQ
jgi:hypothetical protein